MSNGLLREMVVVPSLLELESLEARFLEVQAREQELWELQQLANRAWLDYRRGTLMPLKEELEDARAVRRRAALCGHSPKNF